MKKYLFLAVASLMMASCSLTTNTARTESVPYSMFNATVADLSVQPERIVYTYTPTKAVRKGGIENCKKAAVQEALTANGNADLLLEAQYVTEMDLLLGIKVRKVVVSGRPAKFKNFRSLDDKVWTDPVFRENRNAQYNLYYNAPAAQ